MLLPAVLKMVVVAAGLAAVPLTTAGQEREAAREPSVAVFGMVAERGTSNPIQAAAVRLIPARDAPALERLTDASGRFSIPSVPAGRYRVRVERFGYKTVEQAVELRTDSDVRVELVVEAVELEPLLVVTDRQLRPDIPGWDRRRRQDLGTFITREEIEQSRTLVASEVLRRVPSVRLIPRGGGLLGNDVLIRGCRPLLIVDGAPIAGTRGGFALDELFGSEGVEALEVYTASNIPPEFGFGRNACGAVVVWTRRPALRDQGDAPRSSWKWFGIAGGIFAALLLITR
jgi:hypothetical protein